MDQNSSSTATSGGDRSTPILTVGVSGPVLERAIRLSRFSPNQAIVLGEFLEALRYGEMIHGRRAMGCRVNLTMLSRLISIGPQQLSRAKRELIDSKVLIEDGDLVIQLNRHVAEWVHHATGEPRLTPEFVDYCRAIAEEDPAVAENDAVRRFTAMVLAQDDGEFAAAAEAQGDLERLGYSVRYRKPATGRSSSKGGHR